MRVRLRRINFTFDADYPQPKLYRTVNAFIPPDPALDLPLNPSSLGLNTSANVLVFAAMQIPVGFLLDRRSLRRVEPAVPRSPSPAPRSSPSPIRPATSRTRGDRRTHVLMADDVAESDREEELEVEWHDALFATTPVRLDLPRPIGRCGDQESPRGERKERWHLFVGQHSSKCAVREHATRARVLTKQRLLCGRKRDDRLWPFSDGWHRADVQSQARTLPVVVDDSADSGQPS